MRKLLLLLGIPGILGVRAAQAQCSAPTISVTGSSSICSGQVNLQTTLGSQPLRYASSVLRFSSQYNTSSWAAAQALGAPNVYPQHGDLNGTWASTSADGTREYLVLRFANPAPAKRIMVWETYNPGAIDTIFVRNPNTGNWVPVYTATAAATTQRASILNVTFPQTSFNVSDVRLAINSNAVPGWNEIDAVALSNESVTYQWSRNGIDMPASEAGSTGPGQANLTTSGAYAVRVTDDNGCTATSLPFNVMSDTQPTLSASAANNTICSGGSTTLTATASNSSTSVAGLGLNFDGSNDVVTVPNGSSLALTSALTMEAWINATGAGSAVQNVVCKSSQSQNTGYIFPRTDDNFNNLVLYLHIGGSWRIFSVPYASLRNAWHHVAATYDGSRVKIFIDGAKVLDQAQTGAVAVNTNALALGTQPGYGEFYNGKVDEIRVWNIARSEAQIQANYNKTVWGAEPGLAAYYRLDEASGTAIVDQTSNANTGTLGSSTAAPTWVNNPTSIQQGLVYTWTPTGSLSASTGASVVATPTTNTTYTVRATNVNSGCYSEATVAVNVGGAFTWSGSVSTAWGNTANWACGVVPTANDNITIPAGMPRYPVISANAAVGSITIAGGASLSITAGTFTVMGQFTNNGYLNQIGGVVNLAGNSTNDVGGVSTDFGDLTVGPAGARLVGPIRVQGLLTLNGNLNTNGQTFTLLSTTSGTAVVVNNAGTVQGAATVQRYVSPSLNVGAGYRHLSSPVSGTTVADLATGGYSLVANPNYNSAATPGTVTPYPTVFRYNEDRRPTLGNTFDVGWESPSALSDALEVGRGYTVQMPPQTVDFVGTLNNGAIGITMRHGSGAPGWNFIGNPYPAPLDWNTVTIPTGLNGAAYVFRSSGPYTGSYSSFINGIGGSQLIAVGQGFFVQAASGTPTLTLTNANRVTTLSNPTMNRTQETRPLLALSLHAPGSTLTDELYVYQQAGATTGFDGRFDALKVPSSTGAQPVLYLQSGPDNLSIQGLPDGTQPVSMPLVVQVAQAGSFVLEPLQLLNFPATTTLYLEDRLTSTWHDLRTGTYTAQLTQGTSSNRFVLHLNAQRVTAAQSAHLTGAELQLYPNPANGRTVTLAAAGLPTGTLELRLLNSLGQVVRTEELRSRTGLLEQPLSVQGLATGVYTVQLRTAAGTITRKLVLN